MPVLEQWAMQFPRSMSVQACLHNMPHMAWDCRSTTRYGRPSGGGIFMGEGGGGEGCNEFHLSAGSKQRLPAV